MNLKGSFTVLYLRSFPQFLSISLQVSSTKFFSYFFSVISQIPHSSQQVLSISLSFLQDTYEIGLALSSLQISSKISFLFSFQALLICLRFSILLCCCFLYYFIFGILRVTRWVQTCKKEFRSASKSKYLKSKCYNLLSHFRMSSLNLAPFKKGLQFIGYG